MSDRSGAARVRKRVVRERLLVLVCGIMVGSAVLGRLTVPAEPDPQETARADTPPPVMLRQTADAAPTGNWLLDPSPVLGMEATGLRPSSASLDFPPLRTSVAHAEVVEPARITLAQITPPLLQSVPVPMRRPVDLVLRQVMASRAGERVPAARAAGPSRTDAQAERSFFDTVFGSNPPERETSTPVLAYAPLDSRAIQPGPRRLSDTPASVRAEGATAVYDILARTVTLPSGERLEAHSGLGPAMDNPRLVHLRMRGSTPPGTYELTEREALFHGVRAIRLTPVGGSAAIHGRDGILAHTYMLGPKGASNGCVSFRDYNRFLQAYLRGDIRRLVVVAGSSDSLPSIAHRALRRFAGAE